jgi:hypothetical protein
MTTDAGAPEQGPHDPPARRPAGRAWRSMVAVSIVGLTIFGSLFGSDDLWPFAPFRMYATATRLDGQVLKAEFAGQLADGTVIRMPAGWFGLRPAEIEGNRQPGGGLPAPLLSDLADYWNAEHPDEPIVRLELRLVGSRLENGEPVEDVSRTVDEWTGP